jgi:hypothetical protein
MAETEDEIISNPFRNDCKTKDLFCMFHKIHELTRQFLLYDGFDKLKWVRLLCSHKVGYIIFSKEDDLQCCVKSSFLSAKYDNGSSAFLKCAVSPINLNTQ